MGNITVSSVRKTDIYKYDGRQMVKKQSQSLQFSHFLEDAIWQVEDLETGVTQLYAISDGEEGGRRLILDGGTE